MKPIALLVLALFLGGCGDGEPERPPAEEVVPEPKIEKRELVRADPRLVALAERRDPDLEAQVTFDEVEATLKAVWNAQNPKVPRRQAAGIATTSRDPWESARYREPSEWELLEMERKMKQDMQKMVDEVIVVGGTDGHFHVSGCGALYVEGDEGRVYTGSTVTYGAAKKKGLRGHADCGASQLAEY
jgi:hypothetical protein